MFEIFPPHVDVNNLADDIATAGEAAVGLAERVESLVNREFDADPGSQSYESAFPLRYKQAEERRSFLWHWLNDHPQVCDALAEASPGGVKIHYVEARSYVEAVLKCAGYVLEEVSVGWTNDDADMPIFSRGTAQRVQLEVDRAVAAAGGTPSVAGNVQEQVAKMQAAFANFHANLIDPGEVAAAKLAAVMSDVASNSKGVAAKSSEDQKPLTPREKAMRKRRKEEAKLYKKGKTYKEIAADIKRRMDAGTLDFGYPLKVSADIVKKDLTDETRRVD